MTGSPASSRRRAAKTIAGEVKIDEAAYGAGHEIDRRLKAPARGAAQHVAEAKAAFAQLEGGRTALTKPLASEA
ncbi:hypothetical protein [Erythrobacter litoralis]|uniref:hypothetical protein n=1 Tax=Erythrobacter litoralis TaxID=39960 RepID=UPI0012374F87|nr:hypothetical protein [Erythrobacter litoralis]